MYAARVPRGQASSGNDLIVIRIPASALRDRPVSLSGETHTRCSYGAGVGDCDRLHGGARSRSRMMARNARDVARRLDGSSGYGQSPTLMRLRTGPSLTLGGISGTIPGEDVRHRADVGLDDIGFLKANRRLGRERDLGTKRGFLQAAAADFFDGKLGERGLLRPASGGRVTSLIPTVGNRLGSTELCVMKPARPCHMGNRNLVLGGCRQLFPLLVEGSTTIVA